MVIYQNFTLFNLFIILATYFIIWPLLKEIFWPLRIFISGNPDLRVEASANELLLYKGHKSKHTTDDYNLVLLTQPTNSCYSKTTLANTDQ